MPSSAPFREEVLREAEQRRQQVSFMQFITTTFFTHVVSLFRCVGPAVKLIEHVFVSQIEEEKERKRTAKKVERAHKRKKEKDGSNKETEPKAKKAQKVKDTKTLK